MTNNLLILSLVTPAACVLGLLFTFLARRFLLRRAVLDRPNERSLHKEPVPRGGGLAVMAVVLPGLALALVFTGSLFPHTWLLLAAVLLVLVSWLDDRRGAAIVLRFSVHLLAAGAGSLAFGPDQLLFGGFLPLWADRVAMILAWVWFMNLYNFMDGIDGITGVETLCLVTGVALVFWFFKLGDPFHFTLVALLLGTIGGFLVLNWHPAQIFLGDAGSVPLGFLTGYLLLLLAANHHQAAALILPLYYLADSGITLGRRVWRGEKFWQAHRQHYYQRAALVLGKHDTVVQWVLHTNLILLVAALLSALTLPTAWALAIVAVALLLRKMHKVAPL